MDWNYSLDILDLIKSRKFRQIGALLRFVNSLIFAHQHNLICQGQVGFQAWFHRNILLFCVWKGCVILIIVIMTP